MPLPRRPSNGVGSLYRLGLALFDRESPDRCLLRGSTWIIGPEAPTNASAT